MTLRLRRGVAALAAAHALVACVPTTELAPELRDAATLLVAQVRGPEPTQVVSVRAFDPFDPDEPLVLASAADVETVFLAYPRPLAEYRLEVDADGELVRDDGGAPLPRPDRWISVGGPVRQDGVGGLLSGVRVPRRPCFELQEMDDRRIDLLALGFNPESEITFATALDPERVLVAFSAPLDTWTSSVAVVTATSARLVSLPVPPSPAGAVGAVDRDGSIWLLQQAGDQLHECRLDAHVARPARCPRAVTPPATLVLPRRAAGQRRPDGRWEMVAMSWDFRLYHRLADDDDEVAPWVPLYQGGVYSAANCKSARAFVTLTLEGPGAGVVSFEAGALERFSVGPRGVDRARLFDQGAPPTSCRSAYGRARTGAEVFVRIPEIHPGFEEMVTPPAETWWRAHDSAPWLALDTDLRLDPRVAKAVGDAMLVSSAGHTLTTLLFDPRRPDLPPQVCGSVYAFSDATWVRPTDDDEALVVGHPASPSATGWQISWWRLMER